MAGVRVDANGRPGRTGHSGLLDTLAAMLAEAGIPHCQWKGRLRAAGRGPGDVDLLVDRRYARPFAVAAGACGCKAVTHPAAGHTPGVESFIGVGASGRLVHIHVHYQLVVGRPWATHFRLPIEADVLRSVVPVQPFPVPTPDLELLLYVLHHTLRHSVRDVTLQRRLSRYATTAPVLAALEASADREALAAALQRLPLPVDLALYDRCRAALGPATPVHQRLRARRALARALRMHARRAARGGRPPLRRTAGGHVAAAGGRVIALVGGDGSGKSTLAHALGSWLGAEFRTAHFHLGRPPRSAFTLGVGLLRRLSAGVDARRRTAASRITRYLELLRYLGAGWDRYRLVRRAWRFAASGGIAICERYPIAENARLVGPSLAQRGALGLRSRAARTLRRLEMVCYARIPRPDLLFVLQVEPDVAAARKLDEPPAYVRRRARAVQSVDWSRSGACLVDATQPRADVLAHVRHLVWQDL